MPHATTSSFVFDDGSTRRVPRERHAPRTDMKPPGGATSFTFNDGSDQYGNDLTDRRHTNGLRKVGPNFEAGNNAMPAHAHQPPGGRNNFTLSDGSQNQPMERPAMQQSQHTSVQMHYPPGGRSNFQFNDGSDSLDALVQNKPAGAPMYGGQGGGPPRGYQPNVPPQGGQPSGYQQSGYQQNGYQQPSQQNGYQQQPMQQNSYQQPPQQQQAGYQGGFQQQGSSQPGYDGGPAPPQRDSIKVHAPPGGRSTFSMGWGGDDGSVNHHHAYHAHRQNGYAGGGPMNSGRAAAPDAMPDRHTPPGSFTAQYTRKPPGGGSSFAFG
mmetsp:Transcript_13447/g.28526  ORF Transcript_13447/g.28526 Transcript_13447/m.28526 type:complete len:322 (+) Transcript_13447:260-1225(+)